MELQDTLNQHLKLGHKACLQLHGQIRKLNSVKASVQTKKNEAKQQLEDYVNKVSESLQEFRTDMLLQLDTCQKSKLQLIEEIKEGYEADINALINLSEEAEKYVQFFARLYTEKDRMNATRLIEAFKLMQSEKIDEKETDEILHFEFKPAIPVEAMGPLYFGTLDASFHTATNDSVRNDSGIGVPEGHVSQKPEARNYNDSIDTGVRELQKQTSNDSGNNIPEGHESQKQTDDVSENNVFEGQDSQKQRADESGITILEGHTFLKHKDNENGLVVTEEHDWQGQKTSNDSGIGDTAGHVSSHGQTDASFVKIEKTSPIRPTLSDGYSIVPDPRQPSLQQPSHVYNETMLALQATPSQQLPYAAGQQGSFAQNSGPPYHGYPQAQYGVPAPVFGQPVFYSYIQPALTPRPGMPVLFTSAVSPDGNISFGIPTAQFATQFASQSSTPLPATASFKPVHRKVGKKPKKLTKTFDESNEMTMDIDDMNTDNRPKKAKTRMSESWDDELEASPVQCKEENPVPLYMSATNEQAMHETIKKDSEIDKTVDDISELFRKTSLQRSSTSSTVEVQETVQDHVTYNVQGEVIETNQEQPKTPQEQFKDLMYRVKSSRSLKPLRSPLRLPKVIANSLHVKDSKTESRIGAGISADMSGQHKEDVLTEHGDCKDGGVINNRYISNPQSDSVSPAALHVGQGDSPANPIDLTSIETVAVKTELLNHKFEDENNNSQLLSSTADTDMKYNWSCQSDYSNKIEPEPEPKPSSPHQSIPECCNDPITPADNDTVGTTESESSPQTTVVNPAGDPPEGRRIESLNSDRFDRKRSASTANTEDKEETSNSSSRERIERQTRQLRRRVHHFLGGARLRRSMNFYRLGALQGHWLQHPGTGLPGKLLHSFSEGLKFPIGVITDSAGRIIVTDTGNNLVKIFTADGSLVNTIGKDLTPSFRRPSALVVNENDEIFVKDDDRIFKFSQDGEFLLHIGKNLLYRPYGMDFTPWKHLITLDTHPTRPALKHFSQDGTKFVSYTYAPLVNASPNSKCRFMAVSDNYVIVSDLGLSQIYVTNLQGGFIMLFGQPGTQPLDFYEPSGVSVDVYGNVLIGDSKNNRIKIYRFDGSCTGFVDLEPMVVRPSGLHFTKDNKLIVVNYLHHKISVYQL